MNVIGGRGGLLTVLLGLFVLFIAFGLKLMFYAFAIATSIVYYMLMGIRWLYRRHKAKKQVKAKAGTWAPLPVMAKVGPRDWTPPH